MPDFGAPVVTAQSAINPIQTLSGVLGLQQQQQALTTARAQAQQQQQMQSERQLYMSAIQSGVDENGKPLKDANGDLMPDAVMAFAGRKMPLLGQDYIQKILKTQTDRIGLEAAGSSLEDADRARLNGVVQALGLGKMNSQEANAQIDLIAGNHPAMQKTAQYLKGLTSHFDVLPDQRTKTGYASTISAGLQGGQVVPTQPTNASVATGAKIVQGTQAPAAAGGGFSPTTSQPVEVPPGWQFDPVTKTWHPTSALSSGGAGQSPQQPPAATPPAPRPNVAGAPQYRPGEAATIEANTQAGGQRYNELVNAAADSPARANVLDNIIRIAGDPNAPRTGPGAGWKAAANTAIGQTPGFQNAKDDATRYNELSKFLHQSALRAWQGAGGTGTNQQLATIEGANPNVTQDPATIVALAKYNKAGELALQAKATAHQAWMHQPGNNFANQGDFEQKWRQNFDPVIFQLGTASPAEQRSIIQNLTPEQATALTQKRVALKALGADVP